VDWDTIETNLTLAMGLVSDCQQAYRRGGPRVRYNQAFWEAIYVDVDGVSYGRLAAPFHQVLPPEITERIETTENPNAHRRGRGLSKNDLVVLGRLLSNSTPRPLKRALAAYRQLDLTTPRGPRPLRALPQRAKRLSASELSRAIEGYQSGTSLPELAEALAVDRKTISRHLRRAGVPIRFKPPREEVVDQMVRLYESGLSLVGVGHRTGFDAKTVRTHLRRRGLQLRDPHGRARS